MNDRELEQRLRGWYDDAVGERETAPAALRARVAAIPATEPRPRRRFGRRGPLTLLAVAAVLLVGGALAAGSGLVHLVMEVPPSPPTALLASAKPSLLASPSLLSLSPSPSPSASASPSPASTTPTGSLATPGPSPSLGPGFSWTGGGWSTIAGPNVATLLADGRVLVMPNECGNVPERKAELYDPTTGLFSPTGSMTVARSGFTATRLADGRVLIVGGADCMRPGDWYWASAELYDPATGTFTATGSMTTGRSGHTATLLPDGRVLIAGGYADLQAGAIDSVTLASVRTVDTCITGRLATAELYDPATGTFSPTGSMRTYRFGHIATLLNDGRVLVAGGDCETGRSAELYDPATGRFTKTGSMPMTCWMDCPATLLHDGRVLILGGLIRYGVFRGADIYDPATGTFTAAGRTRENREGYTATLLPDGRVLIAGGSTPPSDGQPGQALSSTEIYDPATGKSTPAGSMGTPRGGHTATLLDDGRVLIVGGGTTGPGGGAVALTSAVLYQP